MPLDLAGRTGGSAAGTIEDRGRTFAVPDPLLEPMVVTKNVMRDLPPDDPAESMRRGSHETAPCSGARTVSADILR
jgi:hypothetical protein